MISFISIFLLIKELKNFKFGIFDEIILFKSLNFQSSFFFYGKPFLLNFNNDWLLILTCSLFRSKILVNFSKLILLLFINLFPHILFFQAR